MAAVDERIAQLYTDAGLTCAQLDGLIKGTEKVLSTDPGMPVEERVALVRLIAHWQAVAHSMHCPGY